LNGRAALIDYGSGNLCSAQKALARAVYERVTGHEIVVTSDPDVIARAERIVLPGVGAFGDCMRGLSAVAGMTAALSDAVLKRGAPFLGICVGMQLLASMGHEFGDHAGLGWIEGEVVKLAPDDCYTMATRDPAHVLATSDYGGAFTAAVGRDNIAGTQFHPEKSQAVGLTLLGNFLEWRP
jgi:glutamine amidotransferase